LAVNQFKYTSSHRIKVFHENGSSEWKLSINPVQVSWVVQTLKHFLQHVPMS
jgi:hypothetical protein